MSSKKDFPKLDFSNMPLHEMQRPIYESRARFKIVACGRQWGKSWLARRMILERAANYGEHTMWLAPVADQATSHWDFLVDNLSKIKFPILRKNTKDREIYFYSGGSITVRSTRIPDNRRGRTLDFVVLDEAAYMEDRVWDIMLPTLLIRNGKALLISTPNGKNWFYEMYVRGLNDSTKEIYESWSMPTHTNPYIDFEFLEKIRKDVSARKWAQEYMADFENSGGEVFFNYVENSVVNGLKEPEQTKTYTIGVDWGIVNDYTCITVIENETSQQVAGYRFNSDNITDTVDFIINTVKHWQPVLMNLEINGIGLPIYKLIKEKLKVIDKEISELDSYEYIVDNTKIRGINMSNIIKKEVIDRLVSDLEFSRFKLLSGEDGALYSDYARKQMSEMSQYTVATTSGGVRTYHAAAGNDDTVMALVLAYAGSTAYVKRQERIKAIETYPTSIFRSSGVNDNKHFTRYKRGRYARF